MPQLSNAKRNTPRIESEAAPSEPEPQAAHGSRLDAWHEALELVRLSNGALAEAQARLEQCETEQQTLALQRRDALHHEDEDALTHVLVRNEILSTRRERLEAELAGAKERASELLGHGQSQFGGLERSFYAFVFEREKKNLGDSLVSGCPSPSLDQVTYYNKNVSDVRAHEIPLSGDTETFIVAATRLLEAVGAHPEFTGPPYTCFTPLSKGGTADAGEKPHELIGPFADLPGGLSQREIDLAWEQIRKADPSLTMAEAGRKLAEAHPEIFLSPTEVQQLNAPIGTSTTPQKWRAPMIGSTRPAEEPAQIPEDRVFQTLNS